MWYQIIGVYLLILNLIGFVLFGIDKRRARLGRWRIPERVLFQAALFGGSLGAWLGMYVFLHKTRKARFYLGIPLILVLQLLGFWLGTKPLLWGH